MLIADTRGAFRIAIWMLLSQAFAFGLRADDGDAASNVAKGITAKKVRKLHRQSSSIFDLAVTPDGQHLLSVGTDGQVILWDARDWSVLEQADEPERKSLGVRVSPDGKYAVTASDPSETLIYQLPDLKLTHRVKVDMSRTTNISFNSQLPMVAVAGSGPFALVGLANGKVMREVPLFKTRSRVVWSKSGDTLYISGDIEDGVYELHQWTLRERKAQRVCKLLGESYEMKWGRQQNELCLTGAEFAQVIDMDTGKVVDQWKSPDERIVADFFYWPRHDVYLTGTKGGNVYFWRHGVEQPVGHFSATTAQVHQMVPVADNLLAVALQQSKNSLAIFEVDWSSTSVGEEKVDGAMRLEPKGEVEPDLASGSAPATPSDSAGGKPRELEPVKSFLVDTPFSRTLAFNANNAVLAVALSQGGMAFFDPRLGKESLPRLDSGDQGQFVSLVRAHPDSNLLLLHESNAYQSFYDLKQKKRQRPHGAGGLTGCVAWSTDRKYIFSGVQSGFDVGVFDFSRRHSILTSEGVASIYGALARGIDAGPKGTVAMVRNDGVVQWFKHSQELSWEHASLVKGHAGGGADIRFIGGGCASIGKEGDLKFWDVGSDAVKRTVSLGGELKDARFLSDSLIAVARDDAPLLELHCVETSRSRCVAVIPFDTKSHESRGGILERISNRVSLSSDGKLLAALSIDGGQTRVSIYDAVGLGNAGGRQGESVVQASPVLPAAYKLQVSSPHVRALAFNSNGGALGVLGDESLMFVNSRTGKLICRAEPPSNVERRFVYRHPDPRLFFVADGLHEFKLIDARTGKMVREHNASHRFSGSARWSPDGKWIAYTHDQAGSLLSADLAHNDGLNEMAFEVSESDRIANGLAFSPRGEMVGMVRVDGRVLLFKKVGERKWEKLPPIQGGGARGLDILFTSNQVSTVGADGIVRFWTLGEQEPSRTVSLGGELIDARFLNNATIAVVRDGSEQLELHMVSVSGDRSTIVALIPFDSEGVAGGVDGYFERIINRVAVSPDGRMLAAASVVKSTAEVALYDIRNLESLFQAKVQAGSVGARDKANDGAYRIWSTADGKHRVNAQLVSLVDGVAKLKRKADGIVVDVPLSLLVEADQVFAKAMVKE